MKRIPNFSSYSVTRGGDVYSHRLRKGFIAPTVDKNGYVRFNLIDDRGRRHGIYAHQAVAQTYILNPHNKPYVNHLDHDKSNNCVKNLAWVTHLENIQHDWAQGKRKINYGNGKITKEIARQIRELYKQGYRQIDLAEKFGLIQPTISQITRGITWRNI